jgi:hypothetical protein
MPADLGDLAAALLWAPLSGLISLEWQVGRFGELGTEKRVPPLVQLNAVTAASLVLQGGGERLRLLWRRVK